MFSNISISRLFATLLIVILILSQTGLAWAASADQIISPSVTAIGPTSAFNDIDTSIIITGADFITDLSGTPPTASLGSTALTNVTWISSTTLTATVPWGMDPGVYALTVVNPDGGTGSLADAFTVTQGIGQWNGGSLFGGEVRQILMKPGAPNTLYAPAYGAVGLFRSQDAGEYWTYISADVIINNGKFAIDPLHPGWLYGFDYNGLHRSQDDGTTWTTVMTNSWPDGRTPVSPQVYVSPYNPQVLFVGASEAYGDPTATGAYGLIKSTDGGTTWQILADMEGLAVQDISFHPMDPLKMVLATSDARVFQSSDAGGTWSEVLKPSLSTLGFRGVITYNPYKPGEVWVASNTPGGVYKSADATFSSWQNVTPTDGMGAWDITFTSADSVYITRHHSTDGGLTWQWFGPDTGYGEFIFDPSNPQIGYIGDDTYGVQKTIDGGQTWEVKNQGLTGMSCNSLEVSKADPLRIYATFGDGMGIYRSVDGASNWTYLPIADSIHVGLVRIDPFDPQRLYVASHSNIYVSIDSGENWSDLGWNASPPTTAGMLWAIQPNPFEAGHLLAGMVYGSYGIGTGQLYSSSDYGVSWQAVTMPEDVAWISNIAFDPDIPGLVYLTTGGTGVYRSTDHGASWTRIDDQTQADMQNAGYIAIATHPQHILFVGTNMPCRSMDGGDTWECLHQSPGGVNGYMFVDGDSTRLYAAADTGLFFSSDAGNSWKRAAGTFGTLQIGPMGYANANGHTILYAATPGGTAGATSSLAASSVSQLVGAGIYRRILPKSMTSSSASVFDGWILESAETSGKGGIKNNKSKVFYVGDDAYNRQYRSILSFNTSGIPDNAVITKVTLKVKKAGLVGTNPFKTHKGLRADIRKNKFGTSKKLQLSDFQAKASKNLVGKFKKASSGWYKAVLGSAAHPYVNKTGTTQFRLRFYKDDNNDFGADYMKFYSGNAGFSSCPQLIVEYYVP